MKIREFAENILVTHIGIDAVSYIKELNRIHEATRKKMECDGLEFTGFYPKSLKNVEYESLKKQYLELKARILIMYGAYSIYEIFKDIIDVLFEYKEKVYAKDVHTMLKRTRPALYSILYLWLNNRIHAYVCQFMFDISYRKIYYNCKDLQYKECVYKFNIGEGKNYITKIRT